MLLLPANGTHYVTLPSDNVSRGTFDTQRSPKIIALAIDAPKLHPAPLDDAEVSAVATYVMTLQTNRRLSMTDEFSVKVLVFSASLREHSLNDRLATRAAQSVEARGATVDRAFMADFDCPSYDGDEEREGHMPEGAVRLRDRLIGSDGFILVSPEYNASMPGILKNVIDWTSRFKPQPFTRRYGMLMSASPSMVGGNRGLWSLRIPLEHLGARVYPDMFSLAQAHQAFDAEGGIADSQLQKRFDETISCWLQSVEAAKHYPMMKTQWVEFLGERPDAETDRVEQTDVRAA